jgi:hypothetical protein
MKEKYSNFPYGETGRGRDYVLLDDAMANVKFYCVVGFIVGAIAGAAVYHLLM